MRRGQAQWGRRLGEMFCRLFRDGRGSTGENFRHTFGARGMEGGNFRGALVEGESVGKIIRLVSVEGGSVSENVRPLFGGRRDDERNVSPRRRSDGSDFPN